MLTSTTPIATLVASVVLGFGDPAHADYPPGFVWRRAQDYDPGLVAFSNAGNPNTDSVGNPVWQYEWVFADVAAADPWYQAGGPLLVWDPSWYGGAPAWTRSDDKGPALGAISFETTTVPGFFDTAIIRWRNPLDEPQELIIAGDWQVRWYGPGNVAVPMDVVLGIGHWDASAGVWNVLLLDRLSKPTPDTTVEFGVYPFQRVIEVEPGDQILFSGTAAEMQNSPRGFFGLRDRFRIAVPCPLDWNQNALLDSGDIEQVLLLAAFADLRVDYDQNGTITFFDTIEYLRRVDEGCVPDEAAEGA